MTDTNGMTGISPSAIDKVWEWDNTWESKEQVVEFLTELAPLLTAGQAERRLLATRAVLADREAELLALKGPCSTCRLHYAHSGPCDIPRRP